MREPESATEIEWITADASMTVAVTGKGSHHDFILVSGILDDDPIIVDCRTVSPGIREMIDDPVIMPDLIVPFLYPEGGSISRNVYLGYAYGIPFSGGCIPDLEFRSLIIRFTKGEN